MMLPAIGVPFVLSYSQPSGAGAKEKAAKLFMSGSTPCSMSSIFCFSLSYSRAATETEMEIESDDGDFCILHY